MKIRIAFPLLFVFCSLSILGTEPSEGASNLLSAGDISYIGAFTVPKDQEMVLGGSCLSISKTGNLYICGDDDKVTEISIPSPVISTVVNNLPRAQSLQSYFDITKGKLTQQENTGNSGPYEFGDVIVLGDDICWTIYEYYNVAGRDHLSYGCTKSLDASGSSGLWHIGPYSNGKPHNYFHTVQTSDYIAYNYNASSQGCLLSGRTRAAGAFGGSSGPALYELCPPSTHQATGTEILSASVLMTFPSDIQWASKYKPKDMWRGVAVLGRTVLMFVRKAQGPVFYKHDPRPAWNYSDDKPQQLCSGEGGGYHAGPYEAQFQLYDWEDLKEVQDGKRDAWDVLPYSTFAIPGWWDTCKQEIGDMAYDPVSNRVYITQPNADGNRPVVHVFQVPQSGGGGSDTIPPATPVGLEVE